MNGWSSKDVTKSPGQVVSGVIANAPISLEGFPITAGGATKGMVVKIVTSAATVVGAITAKLQTAIGPDYVDAKTVSITAGAGIFYIKIIDIVDSAILPLLNKGQIVITNTNAGDSATISSVNILQEL